MMNKKIAEHVQELFAGAPREPRVLEIQEELLANLNDKYQDLLNSGKSEETAYSLVVSGIGDIHDLLRDYTDSGPYSYAEAEKKHNLRSIFISIGVAGYIMGLAVYLVFSRFYLQDAGMIAMFLCWAVASGLFVYGANQGKGHYHRRDDTFVEQYKEKVAEDESDKSKRKALNSAIWPLIVVIYLAVSFITGRWDITWIIFLIGVALQQFINMYLFARSQEKNKYFYSIFWCTVMAVYFIISFAFTAWVWSWMIFIAAVALQQIIILLKMWRKSA